MKVAILSTFPTYTQISEFKDSFTKSSLNYLPWCPHLHRAERGHANADMETAWGGCSWLQKIGGKGYRCYSEVPYWNTAPALRRPLLKGHDLKLKLQKQHNREIVDPSCLTAIQELLCSLAVC